jgi:LysM repeat protein
MRRPRRLLIAVALLAGGTSVALVSRRHTEEPAPQASNYAPKSPKSRAQLPLDLPEESAQPAHLSGAIEADPGSSRKAEAASAASRQNVTPAPEPPPVLADDHWRPSVRTAAYQPPAPAAPAPPKPAAPREAPKSNAQQKVSYTVHRIVDGDTLSSLAQRYLGSSKRFSVIFEANRDRLQSPDLLPIGTELRIPVEEAGQ